MADQPLIFEIVGTPSYGIAKTHGPDLVAKNKCMDVIEYVEVELDATSSSEFKKIAQKAKGLFKKYEKPVRLWLIASSDKWVKGVKKELHSELGKQTSKILVKRISPVHIGERKFPF
jgi:hypothetical protein